MIRLLLRVSIVFTLLFAIMIVIIHMQPNDDSAIRSFFAPPPSCAAPCFMGIRPGVTTKDEAIAILKAHPWVMNVEANQEQVVWGWNGKEPDFLNAPQSDLIVGQLLLNGEQITRIDLAIADNWGSFFAVFGAPDREILAVSPASFDDYFLLHVGIYPEYNFDIMTNTRCPLTRRDDLWYSPVSIEWPIQPVSSDYTPARSC